MWYFVKFYGTTEKDMDTDKPRRVLIYLVLRQTLVSSQRTESSDLHVRLRKTKY